MSIRSRPIAVRSPTIERWWSRLRKKAPAVIAAVDQTLPVQTLPFEVQSLYDEAPCTVMPMPPARTTIGVCNRCWRRAPLQHDLCAGCAIK
jgi:hypothetical protein